MFTIRRVIRNLRFPIQNAQSVVFILEFYNYVSLIYNILDFNWKLWYLVKGQYYYYCY